MKQILQNLANGQTELADIPCPRVKPGHLLIRTTKTLVSAGTERMLVEFGKANLIDKAGQQPDKVKTDSLLSAVDAVSMIGRRAWTMVPTPCRACARVTALVYAAAQFSTRKLGIRSNSAALLVTSVVPRYKA